MHLSRGWFHDLDEEKTTTWETHILWIVDPHACDVTLRMFATCSCARMHWSTLLVNCLHIVVCIYLSHFIVITSMLVTHRNCLKYSWKTFMDLIQANLYNYDKVRRRKMMHKNTPPALQNDCVTMLLSTIQQRWNTCYEQCLATKLNLQQQ